MAMKITAKGIDVSSHQGKIDWSKVKNSGKVDFAILRCGYGDNLVSQDDSQWLANVAGVEKHNIPYGVYIYSYAMNTKQAKSEAEHVLRLIKGKKLSYGVWLDLEDPDTSAKCSSKVLGDIAQTFCKTIKKAGYKVGVYASKYWFTSKLTNSKFNNWPKWVAQYNTECTYTGKYEIWQYSSKGSVQGISGNVDMNYDYVDRKVKTESKPTTTKPTTSSAAATVTYRVKTNNKWLPAVTDLKDYAGIVKSPITDIAIKVSKGTVKYRVHNRGGKWLPYVTGYNITDHKNGYAGNNIPIDAIQIIYTSPKGEKERVAKYRGSPLGKTYYPWQTDNNVNKKVLEK